MIVCADANHLGRKYSTNTMSTLLKNPQDGWTVFIYKELIAFVHSRKVAQT